MKKKKDKNKYRIYDNHNFSDCASATECTGLIPGNDTTEEVFGTYGDIYKFTGDPDFDDAS